MSKLIKIQLMGLLLLLITACGSVPIQEQPDTAEYAPILVPSQSSEPFDAGGLFSAQVGINLYNDRRAYRAGDIITVSLNERTVSSKSAETKIEKDANVNFGADTVLGQPVTLHDNTLLTSVNQTRGFDGAAEADQENRLLGSIAVTVVAVLPNGLLQIRGEKWMTLTNGKEFIRLSGLIRPDDVSSLNTIASTKVADARISYSGTGDLANANQQGWASKFFNSSYWPF
ncbi:MAG: flagellar basal body L-ring protein FlgH [Cellvibrionales bacterium]|nr:flagellar basal body L-ring protein FlgH [Cellvibrionales bacterium]|tara:strand:- start:8961 stop:9647 length:687 start_codon:yes stop_codon:yes gene_type:complete